MQYYSSLLPHTTSVTVNLEKTFQNYNRLFILNIVGILISKMYRITQIWDAIFETINAFKAPGLLTIFFPLTNTFLLIFFFNIFRYMSNETDITEYPFGVTIVDLISIKKLIHVWGWWKTVTMLRNFQGYAVFFSHVWFVSVCFCVTWFLREDLNIFPQDHCKDLC